MYTTRLKRKNI